jgi:PAS domain S-box-containing protein
MKTAILIVEPDKDNFESINNKLRELKHTARNIRHCATLEESLTLDAARVGFIFANLTIPAVGVLSPIRELNRYFTDVPIIILSENEEADSNIYAISQGAQDVLIHGQFNTKQLGIAMVVARERNAYLQKLKVYATDYKHHFDNGPIPMWVIDAKTLRFLIVNKAAEKKYGYSLEEFTRMTVLDIRPKDDVAPMLDNFSKKEKQSYFDAGYWRHKKKNGAVFHVHIYTHRTIFEGNECRLCFAVDVNDKILAVRENKLLIARISEQKEELDSILSSINDAIWSRDANTHELLYTNKAYYDLYGFVKGEKEPRKELDINTIHPDDRAMLLAAIEEVKTQGKAEYTYRFIDKAGKVKVLNGRANLIKGADGKPDTIDGITVDITHEKELYDAIRNSEQKLLATINNTKDLIWSVNRDLKIIFCNRAFQDFFYKKKGVALDAGDYILGPWNTDAFIKRRISEYDRALNGEHFTTVIEEDFDGAKQYNEINSSPIIDIDEKIVGVNCISRDITDQVNQLKEIRQQNDKLREIAWIQSHKVRGPLATIMGLIPLFDLDGEANAHNKDIIEKLKTATDVLDGVIKEIVINTRMVVDAGLK